MEKQIQIAQQKQIEIAAEYLARLLIEQATIRKSSSDGQKIDKKYGKPNK